MINLQMKSEKGKTYHKRIGAQVDLVVGGTRAAERQRLLFLLLSSGDVY
jgi:hypothetical protein